MMIRLRACERAIGIRDVACVAAMLTLLLMQSTHAAEPTRPPNIVFILADDKYYDIAAMVKQCHEFALNIAKHAVSYSDGNFGRFQGTAAN